jgi:hypothetical protein
MRGQSEEDRTTDASATSERGSVADHGRVEDRFTNDLPSLPEIPQETRVRKSTRIAGSAGFASQQVVDDIGGGARVAVAREQAADAREVVPAVTKGDSGAPDLPICPSPTFAMRALHRHLRPTVS